MYGAAEPLHLRERRLLGIHLDELLPLGRDLLGVALAIEIDRGEPRHLLGDWQRWHPRDA